jgi:hypothetical protein
MLPEVKLLDMLDQIVDRLHGIHKEFARRNQHAEMVHEYFVEREKRRTEQREKRDKQKTAEREDGLQTAKDMFAHMMGKEPFASATGPAVAFRQGLICPKCGVAGLEFGSEDSDMAYCQNCKQWSSITGPEPNESLPQLPPAEKE